MCLCIVIKNRNGNNWTDRVAYIHHGCSNHYYRMDLLSQAVTAFSPGYRAGTTIPGLKVSPLVLGHRAGTKEGSLVPVGVTNRN